MLSRHPNPRRALKILFPSHGSSATLSRRQCRGTSALLSALFRSTGLTSAGSLVERLRPLSEKERLTLLVEQAPRRFVPVLLRYRYFALVLALNLPGNALLGGGGGIALLAGISGMFAFPKYLIPTSVAALPIPLATLLFGRIF
jgi:hypothetical protein